MVRKLKSDQKETIPNRNQSNLLVRRVDDVKEERLDIDDCTEFVEEHELFYESPVDTDSDDNGQRMNDIIEIESIPMPDTDSDDNQQQLTQILDIESIPMPDDHTYHDVNLTVAHVQHIAAGPTDDSQDSILERVLVFIVQTRIQFVKNFFSYAATYR